VGGRDGRLDGGHSYVTERQTDCQYRLLTGERAQQRRPMLPPDWPDGECRQFPVIFPNLTPWVIITGS